MTGDSTCSPGRMAGCDLGSLFLRDRDSLYYYNLLSGLLSVHPYSFAQDTLLIGEHPWALTIAGTPDELPLKEVNHAGTYRLRPLARAPYEVDVEERLRRETLQLTRRGNRITIHPAADCGDAPRSSHAVVESGTPDTVQYMSWNGISAPLIGTYRLFQMEGYGVFLLEESGEDSGRFRTVDHFGNLQGGLYRWQPNYYAPIPEDLRGRWQGHRVISYAELAAEDNRLVVPKWGLTQGNSDRSPQPLRDLHPDSTYRFGLIIDEQFTVYLEMNGYVIASFPDLYRSIVEKGLLHAENDGCQMLSFQRGPDRESLTTNLTLSFKLPGGEQEGFPVRLSFERVAR